MSDVNNRINELVETFEKTTSSIVKFSEGVLEQKKQLSKHKEQIELSTQEIIETLAKGELEAQLNTVLERIEKANDVLTQKMNELNIKIQKAEQISEQVNNPTKRLERLLKQSTHHTNNRAKQRKLKVVQIKRRQKLSTSI